MSASASRLGRAALAALALAGAAVAPAVARAQRTEPDSALTRFLGGLADSTDRYFGVTAAPLDTAGLDSALVSGLARPAAARHRLRLSYWPDLRFDRVDGASWGAGAALGRERGGARLEARLRHATGSDTWLGGGSVTLARPLRERPLRLTVGAHRYADGMDRDGGGRLATLRALISGQDARRLLRRDGLEAGLDHERTAWRAGIGYRDQLERPLAVTTTWNLTHSDLLVPDNLPAWRGRARELRLSAGAHLPGTPLELDVTHLTSGAALNSDFEYRRTRVALTGDVGLGRRLAAVPQLVYGRLSGQPVPQAAFFLGGAGSLRSLAGAARGGTGLALARLDLVTTFDVLAAARLPHPGALPLQAGVFAGAGAVWGLDPYTGRARPGVDWPRAADGLAEAGVSLLYQPGIPSPLDLLRVDLAWPLGPGGDGARLSVSYTRAPGSRRR